MWHIYKSMLILTLDYNIAKAEPYMFKHNKHKIEEQKEKKKKKQHNNNLLYQW